MKKERLWFGIANRWAWKLINMWRAFSLGALERLTELPRDGDNEVDWYLLVSKTVPRWCVIYIHYVSSSGWFQTMLFLVLRCRITALKRVNDQTCNVLFVNGPLKNIKIPRPPPPPYVWSMDSGLVIINCV